MLRPTAVSALLSLCLLLSAAAAQATAQQSQPASGSQSSSQKKIEPGTTPYGIERARPKAKGALRLATYNAENLFDDFDDPTLSGEYDDKDETTRKVRREAIAKAIRELDADILFLQEIESKRCLEWFRDTYLKGMGYDYAASEDVDYFRGIEQSVLSRVPIVKAQVFTGEDLVISDMESRRTDAEAKRFGGKWAEPKGARPEKFQRSPLRVDLRTKDGYALTAFVVHFKAGRDFSHHRELEALQVEAWVREELERNPDANIAVVGDFNGRPSDMNVKVLRTGLVSGYDWRFDKKAPSERYVTHASGRSIDFIVMSDGLAADAVDGSYFVLGTPHAGSDWDWRKADENPPPDAYASDHYPVAIEIMTSPDKPASAFKRAAAEEREASPDRETAVVPPVGLRSDARSPTIEEVERHAKPDGEPSRADRTLAAALREAGWRYQLPYPKSKTAQWSNRGGNSTWWPGYWTNEKSGATSRAAPSEKNRMQGDGKAAPAKDDYTKTGAPGPVSWVEWLCSAEGTEKK